MINWTAYKTNNKQKLLSNGDILRWFLSLTRTKESSTIITQEILHFFKCARILAMGNFNIIPKINKIYLNWRAFLKGKYGRSKSQRNKEETFKESLEDLFDIATANDLQFK